MGSKCFRPLNENRQPVYVSSLQNAFDAAHLVDQQKKCQKNQVIQQIMANEQRQGNLKKLFDHLNSHQKNIIPAIKECNKKTTFEKSFATVVISNMFCVQLVKMLADRKAKYQLARAQSNIAQSSIKLRNLALTDQFAFRNMVHEIESHFFQLVTKIFVYNKQKTIKNSISETLVQYSATCDGKITAKKQLKSILDLYLGVVFEKNFDKIDKNSFLPFYAYSTLISKSKNELFTADFIDKHFSFILKLFFELEDTKASNKSLIESQDFNVFQESIEGIIREFIIFSSSSKKIQQHIFHEIMLAEDAAEFHPYKTIKLENIIFESLDNSTREHFMLDWLGYLLKYISKTVGHVNQSFMDSFAQSLQEIHLHNLSGNSMKNSFHTQAKTNSIETLKRWFVENLLNTEKTLEYFSYRIFEALLLNLYNPIENSEEVISKTKEVLNYILGRKPKKLSQILIILNKQLRNPKNQYFCSEHHKFSTNGTGGPRALVLVQEETAQGLWENDINFIIQGLTINHSEIRLTSEEIQQIYAPVIKANRLSINLLYLIELGSISLRYSDLKSEQAQISVYSFLISLTGCLKVSDREIDSEFARKFTQKSKFLFQQLFLHCEVIVYSFRKYNFKNLLKEDKDHKLWTMVLILVILIDILIEENKHKGSDRYKNLHNFLEEILSIIRLHQVDSRAVHEIYTRNKGLFDFSERFSAHLQKIKLKALDQFEMNSESFPVSLSNIENSVLSSRLSVSESNPDSDFKKIYQMIFKK